MTVMTTLISRSSAIPLHLQIRRGIQEQILSGELRPGDRLPNEHEYAQRLGVSLSPVRQALLDLVDAGLIVRMKRRGTFVRESRLEEHIDLLGSFTDGLRRRGVPMQIDVLDQGRVTASAETARSLGLSLGSKVVRLRRLALVSGIPAAILDAALPAKRFARLADLPGFAEGRSLYATLASEFGTRVGVARSEIEVGRLSEEEANLLAQAEGSPSLRVRSVTSDTAGQPVEVATVVYRADRFTFTITSQRTADIEPAR